MKGDKKMKKLICNLLALLLFVSLGIAERPPQAEQPKAAAVEAAAQENKPQLWTEEDAELLAKTLYGEAGSSWIATEQKAAVVWCVLNRVDAGRGSIAEVVTADKQFLGYDPNHPVTTELHALAVDVLERWQAEHEGQTNVGRTLPADYLYFTGDGEVNYFTSEWQTGPAWDWSLPSPY